MISRLILAVMSCLAVSSSVSSLAAIQDPDFTETSWISVGGGVTGMARVPDGSGRVARNAEREGSYGSDSADAERPRSRTRCRSERHTSSCP